ncbi:MAG: DinB family protein [Aggregatilineales bacterium]
MVDHFLEKMFEHNNWANLQIIRTCATLSNDQLNAEPQSATQGSIRSTLQHLVTAQQHYLRHLTLPLEERLTPVPTPPFAELEQFLTTSGDALLALARDPASIPNQGQIKTPLVGDGYLVEPWVLMVQIINHATEHREQIKNMLSALGVTPPNIDGWMFGEAVNALIPISTAS